MLRVALDGRRLQDRPLTGAGRWLANVVPHLASKVEFTVLTDQRRPPADLDVTQRALRIPPGLPEIVWLETRVPAALRGFDGIFHASFHAIPLLTNVPAVLQLNDLSFEVHPEDFSPAKRTLFRYEARRAAKRARQVVTISQHARASIMEHYGVDPDRISVAPPAVDPIFGRHRRDAVEPILAHYGISGPYIVALGGARRRGLDVSVAAWRRLAPDGDRLMLVVVGSEAPPAAAGIVHVGRVDDDTWSALLAGATVLCYPTRFEGYGMPALEAAASGVPVVCAPVGPLPEVLGDAAQWCDDTSAESVAAGLCAVITDDHRHDELVAAGLDRAAAAPSWADAADTVLAAYERTASG